MKRLFYILIYFNLSIFIATGSLFAEESSIMDSNGTIKYQDAKDRMELALSIAHSNNENAIMLEQLSQISDSFVTPATPPEIPQDQELNKNKNLDLDLAFYQKQADEFLSFNMENLRRDMEIHIFLAHFDILQGLTHFKRNGVANNKSGNSSIFSPENLNFNLPTKKRALFRQASLNIKINPMKGTFAPVRIGQTAINIYKWFKYIQTLPDNILLIINIKISSFLHLSAFNATLFLSILLVSIFFISFLQSSISKSIPFLKYKNSKLSIFPISSLRNYLSTRSDSVEAGFSSGKPLYPSILDMNLKNIIISPPPPKSPGRGLSKINFFDYHVILRIFFKIHFRLNAYAAGNLANYNKNKKCDKAET